MNSNTKLCPELKSILKDIKTEARDTGIQWGNNGKTTVAWKLMGNTVRFSTSVTSPDETKFRRKVGEYTAITRLMWDNEYVVLSINDFYNLLDTLRVYTID